MSETGIHAVWATPVPPVSTAGWSLADWQRFESAYKPADYDGDPYNQEDWEQYVSLKETKFVREFYASYGFDAICNHLSATLKH